jgi:hypothetical protein
VKTCCDTPGRLGQQLALTLGAAGAGGNQAGEALGEQEILLA